MIFCVLCLTIVPLPPGKNPFEAQLNNNNNNNNNNNTSAERSYDLVFLRFSKRVLLVKQRNWGAYRVVRECTGPNMQIEYKSR
jgi:hypothetical protein